jgi:hypothetical protein
MTPEQVMIMAAVAGALSALMCVLWAARAYWWAQKAAVSAERAVVAEQRAEYWANRAYAAALQNGSQEAIAKGPQGR